jgi:hypothetical protein
MRTWQTVALCTLSALVAGGVQERRVQQREHVIQQFVQEFPRINYVAYRQSAPDLFNRDGAYSLSLAPLDSQRRFMMYEVPSRKDTVSADSVLNFILPTRSTGCERLTKNSGYECNFVVVY